MIVALKGKAIFIHFIANSTFLHAKKCIGGFIFGLMFNQEQQQQTLPTVVFTLFSYYPLSL